VSAKLIATITFIGLLAASTWGQTFDDRDMILTEPTQTSAGALLDNLAGCTALATDNAGQVRFDFVATSPSGGGTHRIIMSRFYDHTYIQAYCVNESAQEGPATTYNQDRSGHPPGKPGLAPATD